VNNPGGWRPNPYDTPGGSYGAPGWQQPMQPMPMQPYYAPQPPPQSASGNAIAAIVLAVLAWAGFWCLTGIPGFFLARSELAAINARQSPVAGKGLAQAAYWMCLVNLLLVGVGLAAVGLLVAFGVAFR
jgi:hypothetical protein